MKKLQPIIMKLVLVQFLLYLFSYGMLFGQDSISKDPDMIRIRKNSIYFEVLGNGVVYSFNYDRIIPIQKKLGLFARIGGNEYHGADSNDVSFNFIFATGILYGGPKHFLEPGIGYTYFTGFPDRLFTIMTAYRFLGLKGFMLKVSPMYIFNSEKGDTFGNSLWIGLSLGYSF